MKRVMNKPMRVLICGAAPRRGVGGWTDVYAILRELRKLPNDVVIIHGDAHGADRLAGSVADGIGLKVIPVPAEWHRYGRGAGPVRNRAMLEMGPDLVIAFHADIASSAGTAHMVKIAREAGVEVRVYSA